MASKAILAPAILEKNCLHHCLHNSGSLSPHTIADIKTQMKLVNKRNHDIMKLAKAKWYKGVCSKINKMNIDPRLAWENIRILTGGKTAHHKTNLNMSMCLENGELTCIKCEGKHQDGSSFINLTVKLASNDRVGKKVQGKQGDKQHALTLASFYHPCTKTGKDKVYLCFLQTLNTLHGQSPSKSEIIMGANINSNIGTLNGLHSAEFCTTLGPHGLPKWNKKGKNLLHIYLAHCLRIMTPSSKQNWEARDTALG